MNSLHTTSAPRTGAKWLLVLSLTGWLLATLLAVYVAPHAYKRLIVRIPVLQQGEWAETLQRKQEQISQTPWNDPRPLHVFFGDSQVELGNWYDLFRGSFAVSNRGLSRAKIQDVASLMPYLPDRHADALIIFCGINNLSAMEPVAGCLEKYEKLLVTAREVVNARRLVALSVMPIRQSFADSRARQINQHVREFNQQLRVLCERANVEIIDLTDTISDQHGGLAEDLTFDGLHLNVKGYEAIAAVIAHALSHPPTKP